MDNSNSLYTVFVNDAGQYGIHPAGIPEPGGWNSVGFSGSESECVKFVDENWDEVYQGKRAEV